jgi:FdhE protein
LVRHLSSSGKQEERMSDRSQRSRIAQRIEKAISKAEKELPALTNLLNAFKGLLVETALVKAELLNDQTTALRAVDKDAFRQGAPFATAEMFRISLEELNAVAERIGPAIRKGFPEIDQAVTAITLALQNRAIDAEHTVADLLGDKKEEMEKTAAAVHVDPAILRFVLGRFIRPFVENNAERMAPAIEGLHWDRGYCPVCGSWPSLSVLKEQEGQRWLTCSLCSHEWRFMRTACPFCENKDPDRLEMFFSSDREAERVEVCHACKRYVIELDLRNRVDEVVMEVAPLASVYLDVLAQGQGFRPGAITDWNVID